MAGPGDDHYHLPYPAAAPPPPVTGDPDRPAADEVRTIFITGLPVDVKERELQNMLRWLPGYETCEINFKEEHPMGFALFSTAQHALAAKTAVQGLIFDGETKSVLHTEMAKENLNVKRDSNDELEGSSDEIQDLLGSQVPSTQTSSQLLQPLDEGTLITPITQMSPLRMQTVDLESPIDGDPMSFERSSRKRGKNFSILEDELLCKAWLTITKDEVVGNLQRTPSFYNRLVLLANSILFHIKAANHTGGPFHASPSCSLRPSPLYDPSSSSSPFPLLHLTRYTHQIHPKMAAFSSAATKIPSPLPLTHRSTLTKPSSPFLAAPSSRLRRPSLSSSAASRRRVLAVSSDVLPPLTTSPVVGREEGLVLYEDMVLGRAFEDMCAQMYYRGKMFGFVHLYNGQEAVSSGFIKLLEGRDSVVSTYRDHVHALSKGVPARAVMAELFGKATGCCRGQGGSMHMFSRPYNLLGGFAFIGEGIPVATGAAFSAKYRAEVLKESSEGNLDVTLAFFGDGTCNNGQFFECLNMAALWKLPIVFVVENNLWAIGMSHLRATSDPEIWKKGPAFGMPGVHVDGMDVLKVNEVAKEAIARARRGEGPTLVECETYRFRGHSLADPDELRNPDEKAHYAARDPITALKKYILGQNLATESELKAIEKKIDDVIEEAVEFADASPPPPRSQLLENVFADPKGFGIGPDGKYRCEDPKFTQGTAQV